MNPKLRVVGGSRMEPPAGGGDGGNQNVRLAVLEVEIKNIKEHMATKTDIANLKVWILVGVISSLVVGLSIALAMVKIFF